MIFGRGAGIVVLKLLDRAIEDGDRIYGVIKGSAVNNDGGNKVRYLAPNLDGQTRVISEAIAYADIDPKSVGYIESELPPLKGVIHCAGVTSDRTIIKQDSQSFTEILAPKVQDGWNLDQLAQKYDLESFILFSSASSLFTSAGQANYCAGNAFVDTLAHARRSMGLPGIAINLSAWENTGLAKDLRVTEGLKQKSIGSIEPKQGIEILEQLLIYDPAQVGVISLDALKFPTRINIYNAFGDIKVQGKCV